MPLYRTLYPRTLLSLSLPALFSTMATPSPSPSSATPTASATYPTYRYHPRHPSFPYTPRDFLREDELPDTNFYSSARFVTHIDDNAIALLREYYNQNLPRTGRILDFCSSWISHFPKELEKRAVQTARGGEKAAEEGGSRLEVIGMGINKKELDANPILSRRILQDLNVDPTLPASLSSSDSSSPSQQLLDASTCVVSIDYLTHPLEVLSSLRTRTRPGGTVHLIISNRCFPTKAVGRWLRIGEQEKLQMVGDYLWWSGWRDVEVVTVCDGKGTAGGDGAGWFGMIIGGGGVDPLWVVRGRNVDGEEGGSGGGEKGEL